MVVALFAVSAAVVPLLAWLLGLNLLRRIFEVAGV
jgi:hypothetical protein